MRYKYKIKNNMYINGLVLTDLGIGSVDVSTGFVNGTLPPSQSDFTELLGRENGTDLDSSFST